MEPFAKATIQTAAEFMMLRVFQRECPNRYAAQMAAVKRTPKDFIIDGTAFTTITVNRNWQTAVHRDEGDLQAGFGVMSVIRAGTYDGCYLVFPKYEIAVDMRSRDVLLADVHEYHGNTTIIGTKGAYDRISTVLYYRSNMRFCGTPAQELERFKRRRPEQKLNDNRI